MASNEEPEYVKNNFQFWIKYQARYFTVYKW